VRETVAALAVWRAMRSEQRGQEKQA
jgi:hypothetical protein